MAFKMAKNSLFAILLRSPWWISLALVGVIVLVSNALLATEVRVFGWMGAFPFVVIGGLALKRQWGKPSAKQEAAAVERLHKLTNAEMKAALVADFEREGYAVTQLKSTGADLLITRPSDTKVISFSRWKMAQPGVAALEALHKAMQLQKADEAIFVHLFALSDAASLWQAPENMRFLHGLDLLSRIEGLPKN